jgi:TetR/AcrR family transcriptional repressor of nem operon
MAAAAASDERRPRAGLINAYLSTRHRDLPGKGCALVTLGAAAGRGDSELKDAYTAQVRNYLDLIAGASEDADAPQEEAMLTLSAIVGAVLVARAVSDPDLSDALLDTVARQLEERQPRE